MRKRMKIAAAVMCAAMAASCAAPVCSGAAEISPNPVISRNVPAYSGANPATASAANDEHYFSFWFGTAPDYLAYDLSGVPADERSQVIAVWYNTSAYDKIGNYVNQNMEPTDYTIEVNSAPGGEYPEEGWEVAETVTGNNYSSRQHLVDMSGYNWIRMNITAADGQEGKQASVNFDIHSASGGISDSWIFFGDSITAGGMNNCYGTGFATHVSELAPDYFPIQENGGIGGITSTDGRENIDRWLSTSPARYVSIAYGTNDAWGNPAGTAKYYDNTKYMIDAVLALGKIPVLPKIPGSTNPDVGNNVPAYNAEIDRLWEEYGDKVVHGPDFEAFFNEHPEYLSTDGVHPDSDGYEAMRQKWAEEMYAAVYSAANDEPGTTEAPADALYGDANTDGRVNIGDAVAILQHLANQSKYELSAQGLINADIDGEEGITGMDAVTVQKVDAGLIRQEELPL